MAPRARVASLIERDDFGVIEFVVDVKAFTDDGAIFDEDAADWGIGTGQANGLAGEAERMFHEVLIVGIHGLVEQRIGVGLGVEGNEVVDLFAGADKTDGEAEFARDGDDDAAFGGAIELGENDAGDADAGGELAGLG